MPRQPVDPEVLAVAQRMRAAGSNLADIAAVVGRTTATVSRMLSPPDPRSGRIPNTRAGRIIVKPRVPDKKMAEAAQEVQELRAALTGVKDQAAEDIKKLSIADRIRKVGESMVNAAAHSAATAERCAEVAAAKSGSIGDPQALEEVARLQKVASLAAEIPTNMVRGGSSSGKPMLAAPEPEAAQDLSLRIVFIDPDA